MKMKQRIITIIAILVGIGLLLAFLLPVLLSQTVISERIKTKIEEALDISFSYRRIGIGIFPTIGLRVEQLNVPQSTFSFSDNTGTQYVTAAFSADTLRCSIKIMPLLLGKINLGTLSVDGLSITGTCSHKPDFVPANTPEHSDPRQGVVFQLSQAKSTLHFYNNNTKISYTVKATVGDAQGVVAAEGSLFLSRKHAITKCTGTFRGENCIVEYFRPFFYYRESLLVPETGIVSGTVGIRYQDGVAMVTPDIVLNDFSYTLWINGKMKQATPRHYTLAGSLSFDTAKRELSVEDCTVGLEETTLRVTGTIMPHEPYIREGSLYSEKISLDTVLACFPVINDYLPLQVGFSGAAGCDITVTQAAGKLSVHGTVKLDATRLTYDRFLAKSENVPMSVSFNCSTTDRNNYSGDITILFDSLNLKATVTAFDRTTDTVEMSFISNSFPLANFSDIIIPLNGHALGGNMKIFGSVKGRLPEPDTLLCSGGCVLDNVSFEVASDVLISHLSASLKYSDNCFETRAIRLLLNQDLIEADIVARVQPTIGYDIRISGNTLDLSFLDRFLIPANATAAAKKPAAADTKQAPVPAAATMPDAAAPQSGDSAVLQATDTSASKPQASPTTVTGQHTAISFGAITVCGNVLHDVSVFLKQDGKRLVIEDGHCRVADGTVAVSGSCGLTLFPFSVGDGALQYAIEHIDVAQIKKGDMPLQNVLGGTLSVQGTLSAPHLLDPNLLQTLRGAGTAVMVDGVLRNIDFLDIIGRFGTLFNLTEYTRGITEFSRGEYSFQIADGKVSSDHIALATTQYDIEGLGTIGFDQSINYTLYVLLNERLSGKIMPGLTPGERVKIPVHIYNTIQKPRYSVEQSITQAILNTVVQKGLEKLLGNRIAPRASSSSSGGSSDNRSQPIT